ncbi:MAG TPA: hypothetical protein VLK36_05135 [Gaiellaceae bacterium]|nr:hypothetical protein [Gaiellaceae bacterium]
MHYVHARKRLLTGLLALALATMIAQSAAARMAPPEPAAATASTQGVLVVAPSGKTAPAKKKHSRPVVVSSTPAVNWVIPSSCTLGLADGYAWGYIC